MSLRRPLWVLAVAALGWASTAHAQSYEPPASPPPEWGATAIDFTNVPYPFPVEFLETEVYGQHLRMAYMDVAPTGTPNGRTVVLFHGFNFGMYAFEETMKILSAAGFRTIAVDRLGFGRSSKPIMHYNFHIPVRDTKRLLDELGIERAAILGHSMGGMVVARFAMTYPETTTHAVFVNQIGMSDSRPGNEWEEPEYDGQHPTPQQYYQQVLNSQRRYYVQGWRPEYLKWVEAPFGLIYSGEFDRWQQVRQLLSQSMWEDPVVYDWQHISSKALVIGGADDPLSRDFAADARMVAESLQNAELLLYPNVGHNPQFENKEQFHADLIRFLLSDPSEPADQSWRSSSWGREAR